MTKEKTEFMKQMIDTHNLLLLDIGNALTFTPGREPTLSDAYWYVEHTNHFEQLDILITSVAGDPNITLEKSFDKWLALQEQHQRRATA